MSVTVRITVENVEALIAGGFVEIQLERATTPGGSFSNIVDLPLVAGTFYYSYSDVNGTVLSWYRYRFHDNVATGSDYSNPFQVAGISRAKIRQYTLEKYGVGLVLTAGATPGDADTIVTDAPSTARPEGSLT